MPEQLGLVEAAEDPIAADSAAAEVFGGKECADNIPDEGEDDELHDLSSNRCRPLSTSAFREVMSQVSSFYEGSPGNVRLAGGAIVIKLRDMIVTKGKVKSTVDTTDGVNTAVTQIVRLHNSAFANSTNQFTPAATAASITVRNPPTALLSQTP